MTALNYLSVFYAVLYIMQFTNSVVRISGTFWGPQGTKIEQSNWYILTKRAEETPAWLFIIHPIVFSFTCHDIIRLPIAKIWVMLIMKL